MNTFSKNQVNFYIVLDKDENQRLDNLLIKILKGVPKSYIYRAIRGKEVKVNNKRSDPSYKVKIGDNVRIPPIRLAESLMEDPIKSYIPKSSFPVLFEDEYFLIINKPAGVACHGGSGISFGVIEQLRRFYTEFKFLELVHRLDRDTSGILILAKKRQALVAIQELIRNHAMKKYYLALTLGIWPDLLRHVKVPLHKYLTKDGERRVRVDVGLGQFSHTVFKVVNKFQIYTLVEAELKTGRTHQIRVHLQHLGFPILGDDKYGDFTINRDVAKKGFKRMFLHAKTIEFIHPVTQSLLRVDAPLPDELGAYLTKLENESHAK